MTSGPKADRARLSPLREEQKPAGIVQSGAQKNPMTPPVAGGSGYSTAALAWAVISEAS